MNKLLSGARKLLFSSACLLIASNAAHSVAIEGFPEGCSDASTRQALPGHILRLGTINVGPGGLFFSFPDRNDTTNLQTVDLADNVGLIGQDPSQDISQMVRTATPDGSFVVAQVFIGDEQDEPVVTCISQMIPVTRYVPSDYGDDWSWLDPGIFVERLRWKRHSHWNWRGWWRRDFDRIRGDFRRSDRHRDFRRFRRDDQDRGRDRDHNRDRDGNRQMIIKKDTDMRKGRDRIIDRTPDRRRDGTGDRQMDIKKGAKDTNRERIFDRVKDRVQGDRNRDGKSGNRTMTIKKDSVSSNTGDTKRGFRRRTMDQNKTSTSSGTRTNRVAKNKIVDGENKVNP